MSIAPISDFVSRFGSLFSSANVKPGRLRAGPPVQAAAGVDIGQSRSVKSGSCDSVQVVPSEILKWLWHQSWSIRSHSGVAIVTVAIDT